MQKACKILILIILVTGSFVSAFPAGSATVANQSYASEIRQYVAEDKVYLLENIRQKVSKPSEKIVVEALLTYDGPKAVALYKKQLAEHPDPALDAISKARILAFEQMLGITPNAAALPLQANTPSKTSAQAQPRQKSDTAESAPLAETETMAQHQVPKSDTTARGIKSPAPAPKVAAAPSSTAPATAAVPAYKPITAPAIAAPAATTAPAPKPKPQAAAHSKPSAPQPGVGYTLQLGSFDSVTNAELLANQISQTSAAKVILVKDVYKVRLVKQFPSRQDAVAFAKTLPVESYVVPVQP